jgi:hypothetical protein
VAVEEPFELYNQTFDETFRYRRLTLDETASKEKGQEVEFYDTERNEAVLGRINSQTRVLKNGTVRTTVLIPRVERRAGGPPMKFGQKEIRKIDLKPGDLSPLLEGLDVVAPTEDEVPFGDDLKGLIEQGPSAEEIETAPAEEEAGEVEQPRKVKHFTRPESAEALRKGEPFDFTKESVHLVSEMPTRIAGEGRMYMALDDESWASKSVVDRNVPERRLESEERADRDERGRSLDEVYYDYTKQKWMIRKGAQSYEELEAVEYDISPGARTIVIDSQDALQRVVNKYGGWEGGYDIDTKPIPGPMWDALAEDYDAVEIRVSDTDRENHPFFRMATNDQLVVLNPDVATVAKSTETASRAQGLPVEGITQEQMLEEETAAYKEQDEPEDRLARIEEKLDRVLEQEESLEAPAEEPPARLFSEAKAGSEFVAKPSAWLSRESETEKGAKVRNNIKRDKRGTRYGMQSIIDMLAQEVSVDLRVGPGQVSTRHPAHYMPRYHVIRTKASASGINVHEIGHALSEYVRDTNPDLYEAIKDDLITLAKGSDYASAPTAEEGFAEWVRMYVMSPGSVDDLPITSHLEKHLPRSSFAALRDAARAFDEHLARTPEAQFRSFSTDKPAKPPLFERINSYVDRVLYYGISRRVAINADEARIWKAFKKHSDGRLRGARLARGVLKKLKGTSADVDSAYQTTLRVPHEVNRAMDAEKGLRGIRVYMDHALPKDVGEYLEELGLPVPQRGTKHGANYGRITDFSQADIIKKVGGQLWDEFDNYGQARTSLYRAKHFGHAYPGKHSGLPVDKLEEIVSYYQKKHPHFRAAYDMQQKYFDGLLVVSYLGGLKSLGELKAMTERHIQYWPLLRNAEGYGQLSGGGPRIDAGYRYARGSELPIKPILEVVRQRTYEVIEAYYMNRLALAPVRRAAAIDGMEDVPFLARAEVNQVAVPLRLETKKMQGLRAHEIVQEIADYMNLQALQEYVDREQNKGSKPENRVMASIEELRDLTDDQFLELTGRPMVTDDDIEVWWNGRDVWRKTSPERKNIHVIAPMRDGERAYYQIKDPLMFELLSKTDDPAALVKWFEHVTAPATRQWKRILTGNLIFAAGNIPRDALTAGNVSSDPESFIPAFHLMNGVLAKLTGTVPDAVVGTDMLSRSIETASSLEHQSFVTRFWDEMKYGVVPEGWSGMSPGARAGALVNPFQGLAWVMKPIDLALYLTGQKAVSQLSEEAPRIGAFKTAKRHGASDQEAQMAYDMVSGNFGEGPGSSNLHSVYRMAGFVNPGFQITYQLTHGLVHPDPKVRWEKRLKLGGWVPLVTALMWALNKLITPDEREEDLKERPTADRFAYMPIGGLIRVPFDYGLVGAVQAYTWNTLDDWVGDRPPSVKRAKAKALVGRILDLPGHPMSFMQPQIKAAIEMQANYNFYWGKELEPWWMRSKPLEDRHYEDTPELYRRVGAKVGIGPLKVQHFARSMAVQIDEALRQYEMYKSGEKIEGPEDVKFVSRRIQTKPIGWRSASVEKLAEVMERLQQAEARLYALDLGDPAGKELEEMLDTGYDLLASWEEMMAVYDMAKEARRAGERDLYDELLGEMTVVAQKAIARNQEYFEE